MLRRGRGREVWCSSPRLCSARGIHSAVGNDDAVLASPRGSDTQGRDKEICAAERESLCAENRRRQSRVCN